MGSEDEADQFDQDVLEAEVQVKKTLDPQLLPGPNTDMA